MLVQSSLGKLVQHHGYFNGQYDEVLRKKQENLITKFIVSSF